MKVGFFFAKQKLNVLVRCLALNLLEELDGRRKLWNDISGMGKISLLPGCIDSLLELMKIRRKCRLQLGQVLQLEDGAGK